MLSVIAGATDIIGVLGLDGLFTAHITGNLVLLAARIVAGRPATVSYILSVPVFMLVLLVTGLVARAIEQTGSSSLQPLLLLQLLALVAFLLLSVTAGPWRDPDAVVRDHRRHVRCCGDGGTERTRADRIEEYAHHRGDDDKRHAIDARFRRGAGWRRCSGHCQGKGAAS